MLNYDFIEKKAKQSQIDKLTIEREYWQLLFLQKLYDVSGAETIFFKGGTAIRFLLNSFRFSEDLDFTSTSQKGIVEKILLSTFQFFKQNTSFPLDFKKERVFEEFEEESLRYRFLFLPKNSAQKISIRIDVSFRETPRTKETTAVVPFDYPISPYPLVVHLQPKEILAEKIRALFVRGKPRDLFDIWYLLTKNVNIDEKIIRIKFKLYPKLDYSTIQLKKIISDYDESELKKNLNQFLPENYRGFYKKLKEALLKLV